MNHTPDVLISDELLEKILYCDFHSFSTCDTCEQGDECEQILNTDMIWKFLHRKSSRLLYITS